MTTASYIRANLSSVRQELAQVFPRLKDDMLKWAPADGMRTIHGQFVEIVGTERALVLELQGTKVSDEELEKPFWEVQTISGLITQLGVVRAETNHYLDGLDETALAAPAPMSAQWASWLDLETVPVSEMLRFIGRHESYHSGQLVSYLWARGDNPYQWR